MHLFLAATMSNSVPNDVPSPCGPPSPHIIDIMPHRQSYTSQLWRQHHWTLLSALLEPKMTNGTPYCLTDFTYTGQWMGLQMWFIYKKKNIYEKPVFSSYCICSHGSKFGGCLFRVICFSHSCAETNQTQPPQYCSLNPVTVEYVTQHLNKSILIWKGDVKPRDIAHSHWNSVKDS